MTIKVLIVDDSLVMRKLVVKSLKQAGFDIDPIEASDGQEALKKLGQRRAAVEIFRMVERYAPADARIGAASLYTAP